MTTTHPTLANKYKILSDLGSGGMGVVYLAEDIRVHRKVAIKRLHDSEHASRLQKEATHLAQLNHPNIVQLYDYIEDQDPNTGEGNFAIVMEYVKGTSLKSLLRSGHYSLKQSSQWLKQIADALALAHTKHIAHRDLKADNILITEDGNIKITDFGIARLCVDSATIENQCFGSFTSLAPEQIEGKATSPQTDIFALGLLAYQLYCRRHPFGETPALLMQNTLHSKPEIAKTINPRLSDNLSQFIAQMLNKNPDQRPSAGLASQTFSECLEQFSELAESDTADMINGLLTPHAEQKSGANIFQQIKYYTTNRWVLSGLGLALFISATLFTEYSLSKNTVPLYVGVLPPILSDPNTKHPDRYSHILPSIQDAIEQVVVESKAHALIPKSELIINNRDMKSMIRSAGADILLQAHLQCENSRCEIFLEEVGNKLGKVDSSTRWTILAEDIWNNFLSTRIKVAQILKINSPSKVEQFIDKETYTNYINTAYQFFKQPTDFESHLNSIDHYLFKGPRYLPLYQLYAEVCIHAFDQTRDPHYAEQLDRLLERAEYLFDNNQEIALIALESLILQNRLDEALEKLEELGQLNLAKDQLYFQKGRILDNQGKHSEAAQYLKYAVGLRPRVRYYEWLILAYWQSGKTESAKQSIQELFVISPQDEFGLSSLASIALLEGQLDQTIQAYQKLIEHYPNGQNHSDLGVAYLLKQDFISATEQFEYALNYSPNNLNYLLNIADAESMAGNTESALVHYQRVVAADHKIDALRLDEKLSLAQAYVKTQHHTKAISLIQELNQTHSDNPSVTSTAALVYVGIGEHQSALVYIDKALELGVGQEWLALPAFKPMCAYPHFASKLNLWGRALLCKD